MKRNKLTAKEMELAIADSMDLRRNLLVPNVSWGMFAHECDLVVLTKAGRIWEIEIKVTVSDLKKDKLKYHGHHDAKISRLYFAIPDYLEKYIEHIPERAGIFIVGSGGGTEKDTRRGFCKELRAAKENGNHCLDKYDQYQIARLGALRIWGLKKKIQEHTLLDELKVFTKLQRSVMHWANKEFGRSYSPHSKIEHLKREVKELYASPFDETEYADCFLLLLDVAGSVGITAKMLLKAALDKHEINKKRTWGKADENGVVEHVSQIILE